MAVVSVSRRVVPGVVMVMRGRRVSVPWWVMPGVVMVMRGRRVSVPWWVMPRMVMVMRGRRVPVPWRVMPRVMAVPCRQRGWLWRLRGRIAAGTTSTEGCTGTAARRS